MEPRGVGGPVSSLAALKARTVSNMFVMGTKESAATMGSHTFRSMASPSQGSGCGIPPHRSIHGNSRMLSHSAYEMHTRSVHMIQSTSFIKGASLGFLCFAAFGQVPSYGYGSLYKWLASRSHCFFLACLDDFELVAMEPLDSHRRKWHAFAVCH